MNTEAMGNNEMDLDEIKEDIRKINDTLTQLRIEFAVHKGRIETRVGMIAAGIALAISAAIAWFTKGSS